jgi:hypothetical protein
MPAHVQGAAHIMGVCFYPHARCWGAAPDLPNLSPISFDLCPRPQPRPSECTKLLPSTLLFLHLCCPVWNTYLSQHSLSIQARSKPTRIHPPCTLNAKPPPFGTILRRGCT